LTVSVYPRREFETRQRLFSALASAFDVDFVLSDVPPGPELPAIIFSDSADAAPHSGPTLSIYPTKKLDAPEPFSLKFSPAIPETRPFHTSLLTEKRVWAPRALAPVPGEQIIATLDGGPVWLQTSEKENIHTSHFALRTSYRASCAPEELPPNSALADHLTDENGFGLLPLVVFLRSVCGISIPPIRASFIVDDPNIRSGSYGCINFAALAAEARRSHFHISFATIPIDFWMSLRKMAKFFVESGDVLSLLLHGNNHTHAELNSQPNREAELRLVRQMIARTNRFEKKNHLNISRIVAPPHGMCSRSMLSALRTGGLDAVVVSRPSPWRVQSEERELVDGNVLQGWLPADYVDGMPILNRRKILTNIRFLAFLGKPIIPYFHHDDFSGGYGTLVDFASQINALGDVQWGSMENCAHSNYLTTIEGSLLRVMPFSRTVRVHLPEGIDRMQISLPSDGTLFTETVAAIGGHEYSFSIRDSWGTTEEISVKPGEVIVQLRDRIPIKLPEIPWYSAPPRAYLRRLLTEVRDRVYPFWH